MIISTLSNIIAEQMKIIIQYAIKSKRQSRWPFLSW